MSTAISVVIGLEPTTGHIDHIHLIEKQIDVALLPCGYVRTGTTKAANVVLNYAQVGIVLDIHHNS